MGTGLDPSYYGWKVEMKWVDFLQLIIKDSGALSLGVSSDGILSSLIK